MSHSASLSGSVVTATSRDRKSNIGSNVIAPKDGQATLGAHVRKTKSPRT